MPGVSALPMILAQCNAVISLVDDKYHNRAWCSVEVMMAREGPMDLEVVMAEKQLTFGEDRPKVLFLERQSKLLG